MVLRTAPEHSRPLHLSEESYSLDDDFGSGPDIDPVVPAIASASPLRPICTHLSPHQRAGQTQQKVERQRLKQAGDHREPCRTGPTAELWDPKEPPLGRTLPDRDRRPQNR